MIISEIRLKQIIKEELDEYRIGNLALLYRSKEELDEYMIDNLSRLYFGPNPENRAQAKEVLSSLDQEEQALFLLIDKIWEGYPAEQIKEMASSYGILEEFLQLYKDSIFHMLYGWDSGSDAIYVSYVHPATEKEIELDIPVDWDQDVLEEVNNTVNEIIYNFPLSEYLITNKDFKKRLEKLIIPKFLIIPNFFY